MYLGKSYVAYMRHESGGSLRMILDGHTCMFTPEYDPTRLASSVAGKFARQLVRDGSHVNAGIFSLNYNFIFYFLFYFFINGCFFSMV